MKSKGGFPQGSKPGPIAFIIKINQLPLVTHNVSEDACDAIEEEDTTMFMDDTTLSEVINISNHLTNNQIGNIQGKVDSVVKFAFDEWMELTVNDKKCKEMLVDFRKIKTVIPG